MNSRNVSFLGSFDRPEGLPPPQRPEVALAGRSNVGKSSLINALTSSRVAQTSSKPGKTRRLNFYQLDGQWRLVDLPGYGYARVSQAERAQWAGWIEAYLRTRTALVGCLLVVDIRLEPQSSDLSMAEWLKARPLPTIVVATKSDKLAKSAVAGQAGRLAEAFALPVVPFSAQSGQGRSELWQALRHFFGL